MAGSEKGRLILTLAVSCAVGIITGLFMGGAILPFHAADQQYVKNEFESSKIVNIVHADEIYSQHVHVVTTAVTVTETSPHGYTHDFVSSLVPGLFANGSLLVQGQAPNEIRVWAREFHPPTLTVSAGTKVTWVNKDPEEHTVNAEGGLFAGQLSGLGTYSFTFTEPGIYAYYCEPHPTMLGMVVVK